MADVVLGVAKLYAHVQVSQLRHVVEQEDWAAYQKELERERRALGVLGPSSGAERMREKRAKKDSSQARK